MIKKIIERWKAIKALITSEEYFLTVANQKNPYGEPWRGPILYDYIANTDRELFYVFIKEHIKNLETDNKLNKDDNIRAN